MNIETDISRQALLKRYLGDKDIAELTSPNLISTAGKLKGKAFDSLMIDVNKSKSNAFDALQALRLSIDIAVVLIESGILNIKGQKSHSLADLEKVMDDNIVELYHRIDNFVNMGDLTIIKTSRQVLIENESLNLTPNEFNLLVLLVDAAGSIVTKEVLSQEGVGREFQAHHRSVEMHLSNLRRKLGTDDKGRERIKTIRGIGYQYLIYPDA
jgi:two-component system response regulator CpxR